MLIPDRKSHIIWWSFLLETRIAVQADSLLPSLVPPTPPVEVGCLSLPPGAREPLCLASRPLPTPVLLHTLFELSWNASLNSDVLACLKEGQKGMWVEIRLLYKDTVCSYCSIHLCLWPQLPGKGISLVWKIVPHPCPT